MRIFSASDSIHHTYDSPISPSVKYTIQYSSAVGAGEGAPPIIGLLGDETLFALPSLLLLKPAAASERAAVQSQPHSSAVVR